MADSEPDGIGSAATLLRIFIGNDDAYQGQPLYQAILAAARAAGLAGVTVLRGVAGYGRSARRHETFRGFSLDLPVIVEIIDRDDKITAWLPTADPLLRGAVVSAQNVRMLYPNDAERK